MTRFSSIFSQLLQLFPRMEFEQAVKKHQADKGAKGFTCWGQFVAMVFCQVARMHSLREICGGLASTEGKLRHLGVEAAPKKSTLAYANQHRPWELYETVFGQLLGKCQTMASSAGRKRKFRFKNKLASLDSTTIDLCLSVFDWAKFRRRKGAVKLHLVLEHDGYLPGYAVITDGKTSDIRMARAMKFEPGTILAIDRGYNDYGWFGELTEGGVFFVTRMKERAVYEVVDNRQVPAKGPVMCDQVIFFPSEATLDSGHFFRRIEVWDEEKQRTLVFLTNHLELAASTIAAIYKDRWAVELFFKAIKQTCKIKTFLGTSANAVRTQIWTALIAMLLLRFLQLKATFGWSLSNLAAMLRLQLFAHRDLYAWLNDPDAASQALDGVYDAQLVLTL